MTIGQKGVALVEFALILPLLLLLTFTATEFGRAMYEYNTLTKSVRDAARYLSMQTPGDPASIATARNLAVYGNLTGSPAIPLAAGLTTDQVAASWENGVGSAPVINTVTVTIQGYGFRPLFSSVFGVSFAEGGLITFSDISATLRSHA
jgi:Flp pilus assembly protein TadG